MHDFKLPPRSTEDLLSSIILRSQGYQFVTDVSGQPIGLIDSGSGRKIGCTETSVKIYQSTLRKIPEELRSHFEVVS
jgi:hypothetical protein